MAKLFDQVQDSTASHLKNAVALNKLLLEAAEHTEECANGESVKLTGERIFETVFVDLLARILTVKKGVSQADRVVKFVATFLKYIHEKGGCFHRITIYT
jgi:condensin complex subunit 3